MDKSAISDNTLISDIGSSTFYLDNANSSMVDESIIGLKNVDLPTRQFQVEYYNFKNEKNNTNGGEIVQKKTKDKNIHVCCACNLF
jgi:hypothetical protein